MAEASYDWCADSSGKMRCVACNELFEDAPWGDGLVYDLVNFLALCKRCCLLIIRNAAGRWPDEAGTELGKGALKHPERVVMLKEYFPSHVPAEEDL